MNIELVSQIIFWAAVTLLIITQIVDVSQRLKWFALGSYLIAFVFFYFFSIRGS